MTCHEEILQNCQQFPRPQSVKLGDGRVVDALGFDNVKLRMAFKVSDVKMSQCLMFSMFPNYPGISSQWELLSEEKIRCSSKSLAVSSVEKGEISKEWKHKDLTGCISWMSREVRLAVTVRQVI